MTTHDRASTHVRPIRPLGLLLAALCALALLAAGCGSDDADSGGSSSSGGSGTSAASTSAATTGGGTARAGTIVVADGTVATGLDPDGPDSNVVANLSVAENVYEPLVRLKSVENPADLGGGHFVDPAELEPALAESWEARGDTYTFRLRRGVRSSHGNELTADDVVWSFDRAQAVRGTGAFDWNTLGKVRSVEAVDEHTVRIRTDGPSPLFLRTIAVASQTWPIDSEAVKRNAGGGDRWGQRWLNGNTAGFGAYTVASWDRPQSIKLEPREDYYARPAQQAIQMQAIPDTANRLTTLEQGDIDVALNLTPQQVDQAAGTDGLHVYRFRGNTMASVLLNMRVPELEDPKVRQALWYATPSQEIIEQVYMGNAFPLTSIVPAYVDGSGDYVDYDFDPERARRLLAEAGLPDGFSNELYYSSESPTLASIATILQASWEQIGVRVRLMPQPSAALVTRAFGQKDIPIYLTDTATAVPPDASIVGALYSGSGFANVSNYANPAFDRAYAEADSSLDMAERMPGIEEMQRQAAISPPYIMVAGLYAPVVAREGIENWSWEPTQAQQFKDVTVEGGS